MAYRNLSQNEIDTLTAQGCSCENWSDIRVKSGFFADSIHNVSFSGFVQLGTYSGTLVDEFCQAKPTGLFNSAISNCRIGDNVRISNVKNLVNYVIEDNVIIENVFDLGVTGETAFGNGTEIEILNEGGGRELPIFDKLSSQIAYLVVLYRHRGQMVDSLQTQIQSYVNSRTSKTGFIGRGAKICNSQKIINVYIGEHTRISGALLLREGTIASNKNAPVYIGDGVIANSFIIQSGSKVDSGAQLSNCFVGQGTQIGKQFSAENSAFFANCEGFHGEACSIFAGPYTVTHHKSTLLIAGLFSFYNAGSGSNQSNHMYKVGPVHQGILDRGAKTGSFSYLLWPSRIGAFSVVIGKHYTNLNLSDFPFSYILESNGKSLLLPAINLFTVGTKRDSEKWPKRDRREDSELHDLLIFDLFNPFTIGKAQKAMITLDKLAGRAGEGETVIFRDVLIKSSKIQDAIANYRVALNIFIGNEVINRLSAASTPSTFSELLNQLIPENNNGEGDWIDLAGLLAPKKAIDSLIEKIENGKLASIDQIKDALKQIHHNYRSYCWCWCAGLMSQQLQKKIDEISVADLIELLENWRQANLTYFKNVLKDAEKEFSEKSRIGYGIDDESVQLFDFESVRGSYGENKFVQQLKEESELVQAKAGQIIDMLKNLA